MLKLPLFNACRPAEVKVTVLDPGMNVPPLCSQLLLTLNTPLGAVNVPLLIVTSLTVTFPLEALNVPPLMLSPLVNVCSAVEASYVPPCSVVTPVTDVVLVFALYVPLTILRLLLTITASVALHAPLEPLKITL